eukprot:c15494_g1_i1 orf=15-302(-)
MLCKPNRGTLKGDTKENKYGREESDTLPRIIQLVEGKESSTIPMEEESEEEVKSSDKVRNMWVDMMGRKCTLREVINLVTLSPTSSLYKGKKKSK